MSIAHTRSLEEEVVATVAFLAVTPQAPLACGCVPGAVLCDRGAAMVRGIELAAASNTSPAAVAARCRAYRLHLAGAPSASPPREYAACAAFGLLLAVVLIILAVLAMDSAGLAGALRP